MGVAFRQGPFARAHDEALARRNGHGALFADVPGPGLGRGQGFPLLDYRLRQPDAHSGLRINALAAENHALGPALPHHPGEVLGAAAAGQQADRGLRQGHLCMALGDA